MQKTPEGRAFAGEMSKGPVRGRLGVCAWTACGCGCGLPARIEVSIECLALALDDPADIDALIAVLREGREKLWGPPAPGGA